MKNMKKQYRLIRLYPGSKSIGYILKQVNNGQDKPDNYYQNGIWFNPSEHPEYWQEIKELTLLEQAKLRYPIGTKYIPTLRYLSKKLEISSGSFIETPDFIINAVNGTSLYNKYIGKWAEIVDDFVLPMKWCIKQNAHQKVCDWFNKNGTNSAHINGSWAYLNYPNIFGYYSNEINTGFTEITFEQFKKYVLKEETTVEVEEKVVEKDYQILSVSLQRSDKHEIRDVSKYHNTGYIEALIACHGNKIHSVKRISDGEVFTIGDKVFSEYVNYTINKIGIVNDKCMVSALYDTNNPNGSRLHYNLNNIKKFKQKLFTTEDGVDIFEGDYSYGVHNSKFDIVKIKHISTVYVGDNFIEFSTKEKAEEYILMNKPLLSLSDVWDSLRIKDRESMLKFVKQKLNK